VRTFPAASKLQRADGGVELSARCDRGITRLVRLHQAAPIRALFPRRAPGEPLHAVLVNTGGGMVEGDRLGVALDAAAGAQLSLTTQSAEKVYRSLSATCIQTTAITLGADATVVWWPQETILFDGARLARRLTARLDRSARFLAVETIMFGRAARGEQLTHGLLHDAWAIERAGRLVWADATRLEGDIAAVRRRPFGFGEAAGYATILYAGPDAETHLEATRAACTYAAEQAGATIVNGLLLVRVLDRDEARLRQAALRIGTVLAQSTG
jgi:urease accessory protein